MQFHYEDHSSKNHIYKYKEKLTWPEYFGILFVEAEVIDESLSGRTNTRHAWEQLWIGKIWRHV